MFMTKRYFEFVCEEGHLTEKYIDSEIRQINCSVCDRLAQRIISKPQVRLEGVTGDFPGAAMQWERKRNERLKQEQKANAAQA
jgi:hypothetical protein